jgi:hypothetical protein
MTTSSPLNPWRPFLRWMLATVGLTLAVVGTFNAFIDPLGVFGSPRMAGLNATKPQLDHHRELARWEGARRLCTNAGIFGNSRAEIGFDPENPAFGERRLSAFNHGIAGTSARLSYRQLRWLQTSGCMPETIILNVEFFDFFGGDTPTPLPPAESDPPPRVDARFLVETVFSLTGLRDAVNTVLLQRSRYPATLTERGFSPLYNYIGEVEQAGHYILFRQRAEENARKWLRKPHRLLPLKGGISADQQDVEAVVDLATAAGSKVHLVIYPYHAQFRLILERLGLGELFADWKRMVVAIADRHGGGPGRVQVWDFSGIAPETLEAIPPAGDRRTHLRYYWEGGHFKKALGDRVIARILGEPAEFGQQIDSTSIDNWLVEDRGRVLALLATPGPLLTEVDDILARAQKISR